MEGDLVDVTAAIKGVSAVYGTVPRFVPPTERGTLLSPRNPLSTTHSVRCGEWVRCLHGLYRDDVGLVCEVLPTSDASVIVTFIPRIPDRVFASANAAASAKRKRPTRPTPRLWFPGQVRAVWGEHRVRTTSNAFEYEFGHETYRTGLLIKPLPPASIVVANAPDDVGLFFQSAYIQDLPFFDSVARRYAQHTFTVGQRVQIISGEQQGLVGRTATITGGVVEVYPDNDDLPPLQVPQEQLIPVHRPGDHVKYLWSDTHGIAIPSDPGMVSFINTRTQEGVRAYVIGTINVNHIFQFTTHMYYVTPYNPPHTFYQFKPGTWVDFRGPKDTERPKRRGWVYSVEDTHALVIDERTYTQVREHISTKTRLTFMVRSSR